MRHVLKYIVAGVLLVLTTLIALAIETTAEELGLVAFLKKLLTEGKTSVFEWTYFEWLVRGFIFFLGAFTALWADFLVRRKTTVYIPKTTKIKEVIKGKTFRNTTVRLDGFHYQGCVFENITIIYNGGKATLNDCDFNGSKVLQTDVIEIEQYVSMLGNMNLLKVSGYSVKGKEIPSLSDLNENNQS